MRNPDINSESNQLTTDTTMAIIESIRLIQERRVDILDARRFFCSMLRAERPALEHTE